MASKFSRWFCLNWFRSESRIRVDAAESLFSFLNLGRHDQPVGLYSPPDLNAARDRFGANCGPAALAAVIRASIISVMPFFPDFPARTWTTAGDMRTALDRARVDYHETGNCSPEYGVALIQFGTAGMHPIAALKLTHWVAICGSFIYDNNWDGWLPMPIWEQVIFSEFQHRNPKIESWRVRCGMGFAGGCPAANYFPEQSRFPAGRPT